MHGRKLTTRIAVSVAGAAVATVTAIGATSATAAPAPADSQAARTTSAAAANDSQAARTTPNASDGRAGQQAERDSGTREDVDYETWKRDVSKVTDQARPYLEERISQGKGEKMAVVLDIDNTSLETHFHPIWELPTPPVEQTLDLVRYADSRDVDVFFVTARPGIIYSLTKDNLEKAGFPIDGLYLRDLPDIFDEVSKYKTAKRAEIESKGYTIIANIGNTPTDMVGGHAEKTFKLPDYDGALS